MPKLSAGSIKKEWFVHFSYTCPDCDIRKSYQVRLGINRFKTSPERRAESKQIISLLHDALYSGWNPHHESIVDNVRRVHQEAQQSGEVGIEDDLSKMPFNDALDFVLERKKPTLALKSVSSFKGVKEFAKSAAIVIGINRMPIGDTKRRHIKILLDQMARERQLAYDRKGNGQKFTGNSYNKYRELLQIFFSDLLEFDAVEYNPCEKIRSRTEIKTNIHRHATEREVTLIKEKLSAPKHRPFYIFLDAIYLTGMRPKELMELKVADIDIPNNCIRLSEHISKTKRARVVPIPNVFVKYLLEMRLDMSKASDYIFSTYFRPGPCKKKRDYATKHWKKLIKDELGLNVSLYSFKGLGGDARRNAGIDFQSVQSQFGHASGAMTMRYLHSEQDRINKQLIEITPDL